MAEPGGDNQAAVDFLCWVRPGGPWVLTAVHPQRQSAPKEELIETRTFSEETLPDMVAWLERNNGWRNIYWMVNEARGALTKKASKEDVESLTFLHVDCDPPKGTDLEASRAEILARLRAFRPEPTAIIDSGGGYQAFWRLSEPLYVGGNVQRAEEVEAYNQQLEILLQGDHCANSDRIMRLPGTWNLPDEKKLKAGRVKRLAAVVGSLGKGSCGLELFTPAPRVQASRGEASLGAARRVQIAGNLPSILVDDLPEGVSARTRMLIVQGMDPDEPTKYGSRSEVMWAVLCGMIRGGCDDETIAAILLDKDYAVSAHVLAQRRPVEYVARQIQRGREEVEEPMLRILNERHCVIGDMGGKCRVLSQSLDLAVTPPRMRITRQSFEDFRNRYMHQRVVVGKNDKGEPIHKPAGAWWLGHPLRRQYTTMVFAPNRELEDAFNLWQGFACEAIPGTGHQPYLDHLRENICSGREEHYQYLIRWMARGVQEPGSQGEVAPVMRGGRGAGKGTAATEYGALFGRHFLHLSSAKHLVGQFNAHLRDCVFLFADEAFFAGDRQHESVLKTLVTEATLMVEPKGVDAGLEPNYTHILMASNQDWVVPAGADERRFFVMEVGEGRKQDLAYFGRIREAMRKGGRESLLHFLLTLDLTGFEVRDVPQTGALQAQKIYSMSLEEAWWLERLTEGRTTAVTAGWDTSLTKASLFGDYLRFAEAQRAMRRLTPIALGMFLGKMMPGRFPIGVQRVTDVERQDSHGHVETVRERQYFYDLPDLATLREFWERKFGAHDWPAEEPDDQRRQMDEEPY